LHFTPARSNLGWGGEIDRSKSAQWCDMTWYDDYDVMSKWLISHLVHLAVSAVTSDSGWSSVKWRQGTLPHRTSASRSWWFPFEA
jgi:hypothetical protein